jgi:O-antigen/teichoic acid export membrane protein
MRTRYAFLNIAAGLGNQFVITALSFLSRTVFIHSLGVEYLGVNALFSSVLAMISLAEAGIGASITYQLYKPVAEDDRPRILGLMRLYRRAYALIGLVVLALGFAMMPLLPYVVRDTGVERLGLIYTLFVLNTALPYFFIHRHSFLNVNQKNYIVTLSFTGATVLATVLKILVLLRTGDFILYLVTEFGITLAATIGVAALAGRMYPWLRSKDAPPIDPGTKRELATNVKAILLQNVGSYFIFGAESLVISSFVSVAAVGLYSNYKMLIDICRNFIYQVSNNLYHSVGNLVARESRERIHAVFRGMQLMNFWLYSCAGIALYAAIGPFIRAWIGDAYVMEAAVPAILLLLFFERGMRNAVATVKTTAGIFREDRYAPLLQAAVTLGCGITLVGPLGIVGVFLGSLIGALAIPFWLTPYWVYRKVFRLPLRRYFAVYARYVLVGGAACAAVLAACRALPADGWAAVAARLAVALAVPNLLYWALFRRLEEFAVLAGAARRIAEMLTGRLRPGADRETGGAKQTP